LFFNQLREKFNKKILWAKSLLKNKHVSHVKCIYIRNDHP
jgi:hypothetical protein